MAKTKKAAPKKAPSKKPIAKKASPKKAATKKPPPKITSKKAKAPNKAKKATKPLKSKATKKLPVAKPSKAPKGKSPELILEQNFIKSLANLESFWSKKVNTLKKECDALVGKHKNGTQAKPTAKQAEKLNSLEKEIALKQDALDEASFAAAKFSALSQKMNDFENEWLNQLSAQTPSRPTVRKTTQTQFASQTTEFLPHGISKVTDELINHDWEDEPESEEEVADDLEDIFMPQDDLSEFEVIEDFSVTNEDDYEDEE